MYLTVINSTESANIGYALELLENGTLSRPE